MSQAPTLWSHRLAQAQTTAPQGQPRGRMQRAPGNRQPRGRRPPTGQRQQQPRGVPRQAQKPAPDAWNFKTLLKEHECFAKVRKVLSGDTIQCENIDGEEFLITLNGVIAPRCARSKKDSTEKGIEEAFGYEARECLRKHLIGSYVIASLPKPDGPVQKMGGVSRYFGDLRYPETKGGQFLQNTKWHDVAEWLINGGWVSVKNNVLAKKPHWEGLQATAKTQKKGRWLALDGPFPAEHLRNVDWSPNELAMFNKYRGQPLPAVVEEVREGTTVRCQVSLPDSTGVNTIMFWLHLSGVQSKPMPKPLSVQQAEYDNQRERTGPPVFDNPLDNKFKVAREAKKFTQKRLLHMSVNVILDACIEKPLARSGRVMTTLYGRVDFNGRDIAHLLLREGHAKVVDWHMNPDKQRYEQFEDMARAAKKGCWKGAQAAPRRTRVKEGGWVLDNILSADCFRFTKDYEDPKKKRESRRCYLASIKCPKSVPRGTRGEPVDEPYAFEAKEFVREQIIGKPLNICWEYERIPNKTQMEIDQGREAETLYYVSVTYKANDGSARNLSEELVRKGLADIFFVPQKNSDERAPNFLKLHNLYQDAKSKGVGKHNTEKRYTKPEIVDITYNRPRGAESDTAKATRERIKLSQANNLLKDLGIGENFFDPRKVRKWNRQERDEYNKKPKWESSKRYRCVVEYSFTPSRFKVRLLDPPQSKGRRKQYNIILCLSGLKSQRVPVTPNAKKAYHDAEEFVKQNFHQKVAWVEIEYLDAFSNFYGSLLDMETKKNLSDQLIKMGACEVQGNARRAKYRGRLQKLEQQAKEEEIGLWMDKQEKPETDPNTGRMVEAEKKESKYKGRTLRGSMTHCEPGGTEFYILETSNSDKLKVESYMQNVSPRNINQKDYLNPEQIKEAYPNFSGFVCAGLFEGQYYRVRINSRTKTQPPQYHVRFIDYGNTERLTFDKLLPILDRNIQEMPPLALKCNLAGLKPPPRKSNYFGSATEFLCGCYGSELELKVLAEVRASSNASILEVEVLMNVNGNKVLVGEEMVKAGLARVDERKTLVFGTRSEPKNKTMKDTLTKLARKALDAHVGMYEYGDVDSEDEEEVQGKGKKAWGRR